MLPHALDADARDVTLTRLRDREPPELDTFSRAVDLHASRRFVQLNSATSLALGCCVFVHTLLLMSMLLLPTTSSSHGNTELTRWCLILLLILQGFSWFVPAAEAARIDPDWTPGLASFFAPPADGSHVGITASPDAVVRIHNSPTVKVASSMSGHPPTKHDHGMRSGLDEMSHTSASTQAPSPPPPSHSPRARAPPPSGLLPGYHVNGAKMASRLVADVAQVVSSSPDESAQPSEAATPLVHYHGRTLTSVTVSTFADLQAAVAGTADIIRVAAGTYAVTSTLSIVRDVTITADVEGEEVVLDGGHTGGRYTGVRVMEIAGGNAKVIGLSITKGYSVGPVAMQSSYSG